MSTEKVVATILGLAYIEFMSNIFRLEANKVGFTPIKISEAYRDAILKAADQFHATQQQAEGRYDAIMAFAMAMEAKDQKARAQHVNDLIERALKKESEG